LFSTFSCPDSRLGTSFASRRHFCSSWYFFVLRSNP
jgi:hypothetical protein